VPGTGLEPACLAALAPKASVSANSTIPALPFQRREDNNAAQSRVRFCADALFVPIKNSREYSLGNILAVGVFLINPFTEGGGACSVWLTLSGG
jgi:hypothetical protein